MVRSRRFTLSNSQGEISCVYVVDAEMGFGGVKHLADW